MIVTLAGHVDHGKTSLVRALTGTDTDRLAEEKRRGLTIDLGFAYADLDGQRVGFVDVPGHHRFVHNMVAGVAAQQFGLVVVAADDGIMPQTREHLQILRLIGVRRALFALTKADRATPERIAEVRHAIDALAASSGLHAYEVVETSVSTGAGIDTLRSKLADAARSMSMEDDPHAAPQALRRAFRLAIDRAFVIRGSGLVVTGTVHSGTVRTGDELRVAPAGRAVKVRQLHVQDQPADFAQTGDRCAVNITGIERSEVDRGAWLVAPECFYPASTMVIELKVLDDFPRAVKHWLPVHAYHATSHAQGHVALLESAPLEADDTALVELVLEAPLHAKHGDSIVLRDHARQRTIGGGPVVEIGSPRGGRRKPARLRQLEDQQVADPGAALDALLSSTEEGVDPEAFRLLRNLEPDAMATLLGQRAVVRIEDDGGSRIFAAPLWNSWRDSVLERVAAYHKAAPHSPGLTPSQLERVAPVPRRVLPRVVTALVSEGTLRQSGANLQSAEFTARLPEAEERRLRQIEGLLAEGDQPPSLGDLAKKVGGNLKSLQNAVRDFAKTGRLVIVSDTRAFLPGQVRRYAAIAERLAAERPDGFSAREFRDATGIGRNLAIEVLEYFDARGFTRRYGDLRRIVGDPSTLNLG